MKKEQKRYLLVEYAGTQQRVYNSKAEVDAALEEIRKYNNRKKTKYICGNVCCEEFEGKYYVNIHLYHKLSQKNVISVIDNFTKQFSKDQLHAFFAPQTVMKDGFEPDINIAYFETDNNDPLLPEPLQVGIKYIPILYKEDTKYLNEPYIKKILMRHAEDGDLDFFRTLGREFAGYHQAKETICDLFVECANVEAYGLSPYALYNTAYKIYRKLVDETKENGSFVKDDNGYIQLSARRKRDFAFFLKRYKLEEPNSPLKYNGSITAMKKQDLIKERDRLLAQKEFAEATLKLE